MPSEVRTSSELSVNGGARADFMYLVSITHTMISPLLQNKSLHPEKKNHLHQIVPFTKPRSCSKSLSRSLTYHEQNNKQNPLCIHVQGHLQGAFFSCDCASVLNISCILCMFGCLVRMFLCLIIKIDMQFVSLRCSLFVVVQ